MSRATLFADWRNHTFEDALHDAVGRGVRYAGMGALHLYVDCQTQNGLPKDSFDWYRQVIASNGHSLLDRGVMPVAQATPG